MATNHHHAMPSADAAWLHMDRPTNPMVVNSLITLAGTPSLEGVEEVVEKRLVGRFPRFHRRIVDQLGRSPAFEDDPFFDLGNHVHRRVLPAPGDQAALEALVSDLITPPIDPGKPLWHLYLIEGFDGGSALLWRIHHCIADGIALAQVMLSITDGVAAQKPGPERENHNHRSIAGRLAGAAGAGVSAAEAVAGVAVHEGAASLAHPSHLRELASGALRDVSTATKLLAAPPDPPTALRGPLAGTRRVAWSEPLPLERIKDACHRRRVTVNDMLLTALAAALSDQLGDGEALPEEIHAMVPVNLRPLDQPIPADLGNDFALILLELPVAELPAPERLRRVASHMEAIKDSHEAPIAFGFLNAMGMTPPWVEDRLIGFFTDKASMVVTNVPGPREPLRFAGCPITRVLVWAPCSGSLGMTVSIFSYDGEVTVGFMTDTALVPDPTPLARAYEAELARLC